MAETILANLRYVLGEPNIVINGVNYGGAAEYIIGGIILCIVVNSVFRFIGKLVD